MSKGVSQLAIILSEEQEDRINAATVWALGQIGGHTPEHAKAIAVSNVLPRLLESYTSPESSEDLQTKSKAALKKNPPKVRLLTRTRAPAPRCAVKHSPTCRRPGQQVGAGNGAMRIHQRDQHMLPRGDRALLFTRLLGAIATTRRMLQAI